jgi:hypothetical protein
VENAFAFAGTQAVVVGDSTNTTQSGAFITDTSGPLVDLSGEILLASSSAETGWQFVATGPGLTGFAGGVDIYPTANPLVSDVYAITGSDGGFPLVATFARNQWNAVNIVLDYTTQTYSIALNGSTIASNLAFCGDNSGPCSGVPVSNLNGDDLFDTFGGVPGSNDAGFIDNFSASTVPEPSFLLVLALGLAGLALARNRSGRAVTSIQQGRAKA